MSRLDTPPESTKTTTEWQAEPQTDGWLAPQTRDRLQTAGLVGGFFVFVTVLWESVVRLLEVPPYILPPPSAIGGDIQSLFTSAAFWNHAKVTLSEAGSGFLIGVSAGLVFGFVITRWRPVEKTVFPYIVAFQTVPKIALAPLFVIWFGFGISSKVAVAALSVYFPVLINTIEGLKATDADRLELFTATGASGWQTFRMLKLPNALPFVVAGLKLGVVFAMLGAIVGEFVGARAGLGYLLLQYNYQYRISGMFAVMVALAMIGLSGTVIISFLQRRYIFWVGPGRMTGV